MREIRLRTRDESGRWMGFRTSALPYVCALVTMAVMSSYLNYLKDRLDPEGFVLAGQPPGVYVSFLLFPAALVLWFFHRSEGSRPVWGSVFLVALSASWLVHFALIHLHRDLYPHTVWLFIPVTLMLLWKPPSAIDAWNGLVYLAFLVAAILVLTMILEKLGLVPQFTIPDKGVVAWENENYWLPLRDVFQLEGRWPGPFGYNSKTGFMAVFVLLVGVMRWRRSGWLLVLVAIPTMLLTGGRGVFLTAVAGLAVLVAFSSGSPLARIPIQVRVAGIAAPVVALGAVFFFSPLSTTGRIGANGIWNSFLDLWRTSIWTGVGQTGIWDSSGRAREALDAHSIYVQELAKFGLIGFIAVIFALTIGVIIAFRAALLGWALPLAIITIYLIAGATDLLHDGWQSHSTYTLMLALAVLAAASFVEERRQSSGNG